MLPHASIKYYLKKEINQAILVGGSLRTRDAAILRLGYHNRTLQSGVAYDINLSKFVPATNRRGGFELFLIYRDNKKIKK